MALIGFLVTALVASTLGVAQTTTNNLLSINTTGGTFLGLINGTTPNVRQWLNVPYAQDPVGSLRFAPPAPLNQSDRVLDATQYGPACPQILGTSENIQSIITELAFHDIPYLSEACLNLALWAPANSTGEKLPVFIWLYGGGYKTGGIDTLYQIPAQWVERTQSHIVISANTRVNFFGYPGAAGLTYQNPGLLDQRAVVEWAVKNIEAFGGDPEKIVLWGQSSGAGSVDLINFAYHDDPIVTGFISDSGSVFLNNQRSDPTYSNFSYVAEHFNCTSSSPSEELECMRNPNITALEIEDFLANTTAKISFIPFVDDISIFSNYTARYQMGAVSNRPAIFGSNAREGWFVAPFPTDYLTEEPNATLANEITYQAFSCPAYYTSTLRDQLNRTTFRYQYVGNFTNISPVWWWGAYHATELPLLFGTYGDWRGAPSAFQTATSEAMQDFWLAFARDSQNGLQAGGWTPVSEGYVERFGQGNDTTGTVKERVPTTLLDEVCTPSIMADVIGGVNAFSAL